jgi:GNAT superfamily N-acetyltransferase
MKMYKVNATNASFMPLNHHLQALLQFYIEVASFIPVDEMWNYFLIYMDNKLVAYATTFEEYLKVSKAAVTISQVLVLPPYQQYGIGSTLLQMLYQHYLKDRRCT